CSREQTYDSGYYGRFDVW
nr:immunoglobulin heavy chain junction region [Macaca mulatta]